MSLQPFTRASAAVVLVLIVAAGGARADFDLLPNDILSRVTNHQLGLDVVDLGHLTLACRNLLGVGRHRVVHALFRSVTTPDDAIPQLVRILAFAVHHDPETRRLVAEIVTPALAMGLYYRIVWNRRFSAGMKCATLLLLIRRLRLVVLNTVPWSRNLNHFWDQKQLAVPDLRTPLPDTALDTIPVEILEVIHRYNARRKSRGMPDSGRRPDDIHGELRDRQQLLQKLRSRYPPPFGEFFPSNGKIAVLLLTSFPQQQHPLRDQAVVLALRHLGIVFPMTGYLTRVEIPADAVADIVPLLHCPSLETTYEGILSLAGRTGPLAHALIRMPFVEQQIRTDPSRFFTSVCMWMHTSKSGAFECICGLRYISETINAPVSRWEVHPRTCTVLYRAVIGRFYAGAKVLLRIANVDLFGGESPVFEFIFLHKIGSPYSDGIDELLLSAEFEARILYDVAPLIACLQANAADENLERFRALIQYPFYWKIPTEFRAQLIQYTESKSTSIHHLLSSARMPF